MASEVPQPPKVDVDELTDNDLRASATLHAQFASSLREVIRLRESLRVLETKHEISELERKLQDLEREKDRRELNTCKEKLHAVEDELQHTKCEFGELKSGRADMEQRLESAETRSKAAERLLGEYVLKINKLEVCLFFTLMWKLSSTLPFRLGCAKPCSWTFDAN